jgi:hypothetical protein
MNILPSRFIPVFLVAMGFLCGFSCIPGSSPSNDSSSSGGFGSGSGDGSSSGGDGSGGSGGSGGSDGGIFTDASLAGDWTGVLVPVANPLVNNGEIFFLSRNIAIQVNSEGQIVHAATGLGFECGAGDVIRTSSVGSQGGFTATLRVPVNRRETIYLAGRLNSTATEVTGYYELRTHTSNVPLGDQELVDSGDFRMRLRDSLNEASAIQLAGTWSGLGYDLDSEYQGNARSLVSLLTLNEFGTITAGALYLDGNPFRNVDLGGGNTGLFSLLTFPTLGRFDDVVLILDDNETLTFDFLLVDVEEGLISGPVVDSVRPTTELVFRVKYVIE